MCVHSDDCDMICEDLKVGILIIDGFDKEFGIKMCDPSFMLGVQRVMTTDPDSGVTYLELTQQGCITDQFEEYKDDMPHANRQTPMPDKCFLSLYHPDGDKRETPADEIAKNNKRGYKHIVGTLLWMSRNCLPEISQGLHQLCKVMAEPYDEAFNAALHMISYCYGQRDRGIRFRSDGNWEPLTLYDSSNKGDLGSSKVCAGHVVMLAGGPVSWQCKQAQHVGASSSHNEYMAAFHAAKESKWVRDLLMELDLPMPPNCSAERPVVMLADNDQATRWTIHGMVTTGNKCTDELPLGSGMRFTQTRQIC